MTDTTTLYGAAQVAALWGISHRRALAIIKRRNLGRLVGNAYVLTEAEAQQCKPGQPGRPRQEKTDELQMLVQPRASNAVRLR